MMMTFFYIDNESSFPVGIHTYDRSEHGTSCDVANGQIQFIVRTKQWQPISKENKCNSFHNTIFIMSDSVRSSQSLCIFFSRPHCFFSAAAAVVSQVQFNDAGTHIQSTNCHNFYSFKIKVMVFSLPMLIFFSRSLLFEVKKRMNKKKVIRSLHFSRWKLATTRRKVIQFHSYPQHKS